MLSSALGSGEDPQRQSLSERKVNQGGPLVSIKAAFYILVIEILH